MWIKSTRSGQLVPDRQAANTLARGRKNRVRQGRRGGRQANLADACWLLIPVQDMGIEQRRERGDTRQRIVVEIALLHLAIPDRDLQPERGAQAVDRAALQLRIHCVRMYSKPAVNSGDDALDRQFAIGDSNLHRVCGVTSEREMRREPDTTPLGEVLAVSDFLGDKFQQASRTAGIVGRPTMTAILEFA